MRTIEKLKALSAKPVYMGANVPRYDALLDYTVALVDAAEDAAAWGSAEIEDRLRAALDAEIEGL